MPPAPAGPAASSMWRDISVFNELGIPAGTSGPPGPTRGSRWRSAPGPARGRSSLSLIRRVGQALLSGHDIPPLSGGAWYTPGVLPDSTLLAVRDRSGLASDSVFRVSGVRTRG